MVSQVVAHWTMLVWAFRQHTLFGGQSAVLSQSNPVSLGSLQPLPISQVGVQALGLRQQICAEGSHGVEPQATLPLAILASPTSVPASCGELASALLSPTAPKPPVPPSIEPEPAVFPQLDRRVGKRTRAAPVLLLSTPTMRISAPHGHPPAKTFPSQIPASVQVWFAPAQHTSYEHDSPGVEHDAPSLAPPRGLGQPCDACMHTQPMAPASGGGGGPPQEVTHSHRPSGYSHTVPFVHAPLARA